MPQPKKTAAQKKKEAADAKAAAEKAKAAALAGMPIEEEVQYETNKGALDGAVSWNNFYVISNKLSVGTVAASKYDERTVVFEQMNQKAKDHSSIMPLSNYFGKKPDENKDPFDRRKVK